MDANHIVVIGHAALDRLYRIAAFPEKPTKVSALDHREDGGGSAANAAAAIARLGGVVALWSRIGDDETGRKVVGGLAREGVDVTSVKAQSGAKTPTAAVIVDERGERFVVSENGDVMEMDAGWLPLDRIVSAGAVLSDLSWLEGTLAAFQKAKDANVPTVVDIDLGSGPLLGEIIPVTDYAIFSAPAFETFVYGADDDTRLATIVDSGVRHAGVTRGSGGYIWRARGGQSGRQDSFKVPVVDTTGAGDTFHGAFTFGVAQGWEDAECARFASAAAALKCRRLGARSGLPTAVELDGYLLEQTGKGLDKAIAPA